MNWADDAKITVAPGPVVGHFKVIEDIGPGQLPDFLTRSSGSELKNEPATALPLLCQGQPVGIDKVRIISG